MPATVEHRRKKPLRSIRKKIARFRFKLGEFVDSSKVQTILFALLLIDIVILMTEIVLDLFFPSSSESIPEAVHVIHLILYYSTIVILSIFELEHILLMISFGVLFFSHPLYVLDFLVITSALLIEVVFRNYFTSVLSSFFALLRLWRIGRIAQAVFEAEKKNFDKRYKRVASRVKSLEERLAAVKSEHKGMYMGGSPVEEGFEGERNERTSSSNRMDSLDGKKEFSGSHPGKTSPGMHLKEHPSKKANNLSNLLPNPSQGQSRHPKSEDRNLSRHSSNGSIRDINDIICLEYELDILSNNMDKLNNTNNNNKKILKK